MHIDEVKYTNYWKATVAQVVEWVGLCLEGRWSDPPPANCIMVVVSLGKTLHPPRAIVYDCYRFEVVVGGPGGTEWQPCFRQSAPGQLWLLS